MRLHPCVRHLDHQDVNRELQGAGQRQRLDAERPDAVLLGAGCRSAMVAECSFPACSRKGYCPDVERLGAACPESRRTGCSPVVEHQDAGFLNRRQLRGLQRHLLPLREPELPAQEPGPLPQALRAQEPLQRAAPLALEPEQVRGQPSSLEPFSALQPARVLSRHPLRARL